MFCRILIVVLCVAFFVQTFWLRFHNGFDKKEVGYEWWDMGVIAHPNKDTCIASGTGVKYSVDIKFAEMSDALGQWNNMNNRITLAEPVTVDTIAHEASHLVDDFMKQYRLTDLHYRAYAQGAWTQCIYDIVNRR